MKPAAKWVNKINHSQYLGYINEVLHQCKTSSAAAKAVLLLGKSKNFSFHSYQNEIFHVYCIYFKLWFWAESLFHSDDTEGSMQAGPADCLGLQSLPLCKGTLHLTGSGFWICAFLIIVCCSETKSQLMFP